MSEKFNPDWDLLEATQESLREHMAIGKSLQQRVKQLEQQLSEKVVIGQWLLDENGEEQGTIVSSGHWAKAIRDAGLHGQWLELAFRPIKQQEQ